MGSNAWSSRDLYFIAVVAVAIAAVVRWLVGPLLDIGMPKLNGFDAARRIRAKPWGAQLVLIALTGRSQDAGRHLSHEAGFDFHLVKPVEPAALEKLLAVIPHRSG